MTTSNFAGRAALGWIAKFHIDSVHSSCSTPPMVGLSQLEPTVRQIGSIKFHASVNPTIIIESSMRRSLNAERYSSLQCVDQNFVDIIVSTVFWHADWSHIATMKQHTISDESDSGMCRTSIQADEFRDTVIDKPGTGHSDRFITPVLRVPCRASL